MFCLVYIDQFCRGSYPLVHLGPGCTRIKSQLIVKALGELIYKIKCLAQFWYLSLACIEENLGLLLYEGTLCFS